MGHLIEQTLASILAQSYQNIEIIIYDDCSTDDTYKLAILMNPKIYYVRGEKNLGVGDGFNEGIKHAHGDYVMLMCADDLIASKFYIEDCVKIMESNATIGYITRWYFQFINDEIYHACRAWRTEDPVIQANNPSGRFFRKIALAGKKCSNKMFIETSYLAANVLKDPCWTYEIIKYDAIAVRVHDSTSREQTYWLKRRVSSPVMDWWELGAKDIAKDYVSLIQIKNGFKLWAVWEEVVNFVKLRPWNLVNPKFWFWSLVALLTPRRILRKLPPFYREYIGRGTTSIIKRRA
jgi:glycosyltransferase involved in cell wall biosynthesis